MKKFLPLFLFFSATTLAETSTYSQEEKQAALKEAAGHGEQIFGGIMLAQKCKIFEQDEYSAYELKARAIVDLLKKVLGQEKVNVMVQRAQVGIMTEPYTECGEESKTFINASKTFVENTYSILSDKGN